MKSRGLGSLLLVAVVLVGVLSWSGYGQKAAPSGKAWEYKIVHEWSDEKGYRREVPLRVKEIDEYGAQGWELVAVVAQGSNAEKTFYFKRAK